MKTSSLIFLLLSTAARAVPLSKTPTDLSKTTPTDEPEGPVLAELDLETPFEGDLGLYAPPGGPSREGNNLRGGAADDLISNDGCAVQCITSGKAYARGVNALLQVRTAIPTTIMISVSGPSGVIGPFFSASGEKVFEQLVIGLEPGTTYTALAVARDSDDNAAVGHGEFTTLVRNVEIEFPGQAVMPFNQVESDGNNPSYVKYIWYDGAFVYAQQEGPLDANRLTDWAALTLPHFEKHMNIANADRDLELTLQMQMDNRDCGVCEVIALPEQPYYGPQEGDGIYWAYSELNGGIPLDLDNNPANAESSHVKHVFPSVPMERPALIDGPSLVCEVEVYAKITVNYDAV